MAEPITVTDAQLDEFTEALTTLGSFLRGGQYDNRPAQPLNGRVVTQCAA